MTDTLLFLHLLSAAALFSAIIDASRAVALGARSTSGAWGRSGCSGTSASWGS